MQITYSSYFFVIAAPFLVFFIPFLGGLIWSAVRILKKKNGAVRDLLFYFLLLCGLLVGFRRRLLPIARLMMDVGAQHCYTEGEVTEKSLLDTYDHNTVEEWTVIIDSKQYYIFEDRPIPIGKEIRVEYLLHSRMITNWEVVDIENSNRVP